MHWVAVAIVFSVLILVHELGHFWMARRVGVKVETFSFGFGPKLFSIKRGETEYRISAILFGGYVKMAGDDPSEERKNEPWEFLSQPIINRLKIIFAGPLVNYLLGFLLFSFIFYIGYPTLTTKIGGLMDGYPAKESNIKIGDKIIAVDEKPVRQWEEITEIVHKKTEGAITLTLIRNGKEISIKLTPKIKETKNILGQEIKIGLIGITPSEEVVSIRYGFFESAELGFLRLIKLTQLTYQALWRIATGGLSFKESVSGPIGIFKITAEAAKLGIVYLLQVTAVITASLAIFNLLPIPVLDGGHVIFLTLEKLRGKPISRKAQEIAAQAGLAFLIGLMLFVSYNDILRHFKK